MPNYREEPDGSVRKQCSKCKEWRRPEGFSPSPKSADLLQSWCIRCKNEAARAKYSSNSELARAKKMSSAKSHYKNGVAGQYFSKIDGGY